MASLALLKEHFCILILKSPKILKYANKILNLPVNWQGEQNIHFAQSLFCLYILFLLYIYIFKQFFPCKNSKWVRQILLNCLYAPLRYVFSPITMPAPSRSNTNPYQRADLNLTLLPGHCTARHVHTHTHTYTEFRKHKAMIKLM